MHRAPRAACAQAIDFLTNNNTQQTNETPILEADPMPTLGPTAASAADADRAALHTTASGVPNEHVSGLAATIWHQVVGAIRRT